MQELQELLSKNLSFIEATGRNLEECRAVSDKAREAHDNYDRDRVMLAFDNLDDMEDYQFSLQRATSALIKTLRDAHAQRNVECALSAKNNPSKLDETWNTQPTSFFVKKEKMNDNNSKSTERQEHIGKMERRIYGTDMADIAVQRANIRKFIATLEDETIRVHQPIVPAVPNTIVPTPSPVVPASVPTVVPSTNIGALFKAVATSNESKEVVKPVVVDSHVSKTSPCLSNHGGRCYYQLNSSTVDLCFSFTPQQPATEAKPVFGECGTQKSSSLFGGSSAAGAPSATSASTVAFSFSKPVESKPSVFGKPAESAPVNVVSSTDEGMMEDDSPADFASGAKSGSLFSSSGFLSGLGSAAPKGEVKNVFGGAINKPGTVANASSWLFAKSGSSPQHSQQTVQPSSFSFKSSNAGTSSTFGKAAFGGGASPFSGGSSFGTASFGGKPAFGASVAPATDAGFASFASAGSGGGFAKFAQQGSNGFGAAPTGSTFGGSSMAFTPSSTFGGGNTSSFSNQGSSFTSWR
ncbi:hypothetical protein QR680_012080 [Steinernema hermaphroditum]|uniref:Uncharacterized protein n=1 Tax=Steinernema hermaphroditum TaxID=289476 RepID=A0AA39M046_9BILA|nr:hypothetical protein QR680_012080 [Steinernema hermaphroditum]